MLSGLRRQRQNETMFQPAPIASHTAALVLALVVSPVCAADADAETLRGIAKVIDGDTLELSGQRLHLVGIDAPELGQTCEWPNKTIACGRIAVGAMQDLTTAVEVVCETTGESAAREEIDEGRMARCRAGGYDLGRNMVHTGWAVATPHAPDDYRAAQARSRAAGHGMWKGRFAMPWVWRVTGGD